MSGIYQINKSTLQNIANALRKQLPTEELIQAQDFYKGILQITDIKHYEKPDIPWNEEKVAEVLAVAKSYFDNDSLFEYDAGNGALDMEYPYMNSETGKCLIDCSTFIGLVLRGIDYEHSRYVTHNTSDVISRNDIYTWADPYIDINNLRAAHEYAKYFYLSGRAFTDISSVKPGDILFHWKVSGTTYFGRVWHISMVYDISEDGEVTCINSISRKLINATDTSSFSSTNAILTFNINDTFKEDGGYLFAARPDYGASYLIDASERLTITAQPEDCTCSAGETATFTVAAQGVGLTYKWEYSPNGSAWHSSGFAGYDTDTQSFATGSWHTGYYYRCVITDAYGRSVTTRAALLTVNE